MHAKRRRQHYTDIHSTFSGTLCYFVFIEKVAWRAYTYKHRTYRMIHQARSSLSFLYFNHSHFFKLIQTVVFEIVWYKDHIRNFLKKKIIHIIAYYILQVYTNKFCSDEKLFLLQ